MIRRAAPSLGIALGEAALTACLLRPAPRRARILGRVEVATGPLLDPVDRDGLAQAFRDAVRRLPHHRLRADLPVRVSLPEHRVVEDELDFESFPDDPAEAGALVGFRLAREAGRDAGALACDVAILSRSEDAVRVRVRAIPADLRAAIDAAAAGAGLRLARLDGWLGFLGGAPWVAELGSGAASVLWSDGVDWAMAGQGGGATFADAGRLSADNPAAWDRLAAHSLRLHRSHALARGIAPVPPLAVEAPETVTTRLEALAEERGVPLRAVVLDPRSDDPAARAALWGGAE